MRFHLALIFVVTAALISGSVPLAQAQSAEWKQLFDGKDLVGWKHVGPGEMTVEDGLIRTHGGMVRECDRLVLSRVRRPQA